MKTVNDAINKNQTKDSGGVVGGMLSKGRENTGYSIDFGTFYNLTMKGTTESESITCLSNRMVFRIEGIYYSTVQNYSKIGTDKYTNTYVKNSVLRYAANCALQLYGSTARNIYFENVVITECLRAISVEAGSNSSILLRGYFDVLNYNNNSDLGAAFSTLNNGSTFAMYFSEYYLTYVGAGAPDYLEWLGKDGTDTMLIS